MWICPQKTGFWFPTLTSDNLPSILPVTSNLTIFHLGKAVAGGGGSKGIGEEGMVDSQNSLHVLNEILSLKG